MRLAFFADMGGFVLHPRESEPVPVNAKQLHWLVKQKYVTYPAVTTEELWDKSKQDTLAKTITAFQMSYLIVQCIGRAAQGLAVTTLELNALAIVVCSLMTSYAWLHKPAGVRIPIAIFSDFSITEIVGPRSWYQTPLDFIDENGPGWSVNLQPFMKMPVIPSERPIQRIPNDRFPTNPYGSQEYLLCLATLVFTAVHVAGWNLSFPSRVEQILWRVSSLLLFGITAAFWILETMASWVRLGRWKLLYLWLFDRKQLQERTTTPELVEDEFKEPTILPLPWEFWTISPLALLYLLARLFLIAEAFMELRNVDATAFINVQWSTYIPHI